MSPCCIQDTSQTGRLLSRQSNSPSPRGIWWESLGDRFLDHLGCGWKMQFLLSPFQRNPLRVAPASLHPHPHPAASLHSGLRSAGLGFLALGMRTLLGDQIMSSSPAYPDVARGPEAAASPLGAVGPFTSQAGWVGLERWRLLGRQFPALLVPHLLSAWAPSLPRWENVAFHWNLGRHRIWPAGPVTRWMGEGSL